MNEACFPHEIWFFLFKKIFKFPPGGPWINPPLLMNDRSEKGYEESLLIVWDDTWLKWMEKGGSCERSLRLIYLFMWCDPFLGIFVVS